MADASPAMLFITLDRRCQLIPPNERKKSYGQTSLWFKSLALCGGVFASSFVNKLERRLADLPEEEQAGVDEAVGVRTTKSHQQDEMTRASKAIRFLRNPRSRDRLCIPFVCAKQAAKELAHQFGAVSTEKRIEQGGMLPYVSHTTDPSYVLCDKLLSNLRESNPAWRLVNGLADGTEEKLHTCMCEQLGLVGSNFARSVMEYLQGFPWSTGRLAHADLQDQIPETLGYIRSRCSSCLDAYYTLDLQRHLSEHSIEVGHPTRVFVETSFRVAKKNNIQPGNRWSRSRTCTRNSKYGPAPHVAILSASHALSELNSIRRSQRKLIAREKPQAKPQGRACWSLIHVYLSDFPKGAGGLRKLEGQKPLKQHWDLLGIEGQQPYVHRYKACKEGQKLEAHKELELGRGAKPEKDCDKLLWGLCTDSWPVSGDIFDRAGSNVKTLHEQFVSSYRKRAWPAARYMVQVVLDVRQVVRATNTGDVLCRPCGDRTRPGARIRTGGKKSKANGIAASESTHIPNDDDASPEAFSTDGAPPDRPDISSDSDMPEEAVDIDGLADLDVADDVKSLCVYNDDTKKVIGPAGQLVGSPWQGQAIESDNANYSLHQCKKLFPCMRCPEMETMQTWFAMGLELGRGREHQEQHLKMFAGLSAKTWPPRYR